MIQKSLVMSFKNELEKKVNITVKDVKESLDNTAVNDLMDLIISKGVFETSGGALVQKLDAEIITKETTDIEIV
ncbi:DUF2922 domain-containing protein [Clostridium sardiniense]|uniref:DUF2922 domain-containing protein n=1 Tax=Clostridium sardiniense TaxID=29369 RepID=A0ABS7KTC9_CLOSR|nr:DUF2922 domain-containing protein [Clostridium sardiniense]MBM7833214.1 actin-like ATPase involved in cell morphogenesis [Clostridium sardiniense]MBY0754073.1 DUF2922 domain-containing protein [Clostridium sardiniense]MDQ0459405.1 actin-like ATPase involved in cell morphogenesis [Clostridium sardiniense]